VGNVVKVEKGALTDKKAIGFNGEACAIAPPFAEIGIEVGLQPRQGLG
jgi:hypothetical protein